MSEIRRLATGNAGKPRGSDAFSKATGKSQSKWLGLIWARWSDALADAGYERNAFQAKFDSRAVLEKVAVLAIQVGKIPTGPEMSLRRTADSSFPSYDTIKNHFPRRPDLIAALRKLARSDEYTGLLPLLPPEDAKSDTIRSRKSRADGIVNLLKSGDHFKIGRSDQLERRVKEIRTALPESVTLVHLIRSDDASGIEAC